MNGETKKHKCQHCGAGFTINVFLQNHLKEAHVEGGRFSCAECCCKFSDLDKFDSHMVQQHGYQPNVKPKRPSDEDSALRCKQCRITFHNVAMLKSHKRSKHPEELDSSEEEEDDEEDEADDEPKINGHSEKDEAPADKDQSHQSGPAPRAEGPCENKCKFCRKIFHNEAMLRSHLRQKHADELESSEEEDDYEPRLPPGILLEDDGDESPAESSHTDLFNGSARIGDDDQSSHREKSPTPDLTEARESDQELRTGDTAGVADRTEESFASTRSSEKEQPLAERIFERAEQGTDVIVNEEDAEINDSNSPPQSPYDDGNNDDDFPTPGDFLAQDDYEIEPDEAALRSSNIESLINSIHDEPDEPPTHSCDMCGSVYATAQGLEAHKKTNHVLGGKFPCQSCPNVFASKPELVVHTEIVHRVIELQQQQLTTPDFSMSDAMGQVAIPCDLCGESYNDPLQLTIHKMRCHVPNGNRCEFCPCSFMTFDELREHQRCHSQFSDIQIIPSTVGTPAYVDPSKEFFCTICDEDYKAKHSLRNHMKLCHVPNGSYSCPECPCVFATRTSLQSHKKRHKNRLSVSAPKSLTVKPVPTMDAAQIFTCELCGVNFLNFSDYFEHKQESHVEHGTFGCDNCPCVFATFEALKTHQNVFHGGFSVAQPVRNTMGLSVSRNQPRILQRQTYSSPSVGYDCDECGHHLTSLKALTSHKEKSHVVNGYRCNVCPRSYATFHALRTHVGQMHKREFSSAPIESLYTPPEGIEPTVANGTGRRGRPSKATPEEQMEFKCTECDWVLSDETDLQNHMIQFHGFKPNASSREHVDEVIEMIKNDDPLTCSACNLTFKRPSETFSHRKRNHVVGGKFPCKRCKCVFSNGASLQAHEVAKHGDEVSASPNKGVPRKSSSKKTVGEREFVCNLCGRSYGMYSTLCAHKNRSHKPSGKPCEYCTCMFSSKEDLALHCKKYHRQVRFAPELADLAQRGRGRPKRKVASTGRFTCQYDKCGTECRNQNSLTSHIKGAHAAPIEVVTLDLDESAFQCDQCSVGFDTKQELAAHRSSAHDYDVIKMAVDNPSVDANGKYLCHFCSTVFSRFTAMVAHVKAYHADENRLMCFECSEEFSSLKELDLHKEKNHGGQEPSSFEQAEIIPVITSCTSLSGYEKPKQPKCELCGRVFLHSRSLWAHRKRSHVTDGRYGCEHCSCGFATARGLENHQLIYHGIRAEKKQTDDSWMIDCDECPQTFTSNRAFTAHKKRAHYEGENGAPCPDCYCIFKSSSTLMVHRIKIHGYEIPPAEPEIENSVLSQPDENESNRITSPVEEDVDQSFDDRHDEIFADSTYDDHDIADETNEAEPTTNSVIIPEIQKEVPSPSTSAATISSPVRHSCDLCSISFGCLSYVIAHKRMRHKIEETQCTICKEVFPTTDLLLDHTATVHDSARNLSANRQTTEVPTTTSRTVQSGENVCDLCDFTFSLPAALNMHKTIAHVVGGKYPCKSCCCVFATSQSLANHSKIHLKNATTSQGSSAGRRGRPSKASLNSSTISTASKPIARKKTSLPPPPKGDILGLAFSAAMGDAVPQAPQKPSALAKPACATCKKTDFPTLSSLRRHENECRKKAKTEKVFGGRPTLTCRFCPKKFTLAVALQDHIKKKHGSTDGGADSGSVDQIDLSGDEAGPSKRARKVVPAPAPPPPPPPPPPPKRKTKFPCKECNIIFKRKRIRDNHLLICHPVNGTHGCEKCKLKFRIPLALHIHTKYAHGDGVAKKKKRKRKKVKLVVPKPEEAKADASAPVKSEEKKVKKIKKKRKKKARIEKGFFSPQALRSRERLISWTEVMHPCKVCAMKFRRTKQLERHERINHPGYAEYLCEKCPSMTALSKELNYHEEIYHSHYMSMGEALESRRRKRKLNNNNNNDETTPERPKKIIKLKPLRLDENLPLDLSSVIATFTCSGTIPGQDELRVKENFIRRKLKRRKGIHMCRVCRMMFFTKRGLSLHLKVHVGEKPFKCRFCSVLFRHYATYLRHKRKHLALDPRLEVVIKRDPLGRCSHCRETFRTVALADIHFEEVHPELKFWDMCEQASNLWKEASSSAATAPADNGPLPDCPDIG